MSNNLYSLQFVSEDELEYIRQFYKHYRNKPRSTWNDHYPNEEILQLDYETGNLFGLYENDQLVGAVSVCNENHLDHLPSWTYKENVKEIARVVISPENQGKGLGSIMLKQLFSRLRQQGVHAIHLLVSLDNRRALNLYQKFQFENRGQYFLYEHDYYAMEKTL